MITTLRHPLLWMIGSVLLAFGGLYILTDFQTVHWLDPVLLIVIVVASVAAALSLLIQTKDWTALSAGLLSFFSGNAVLWVYALVGPRDETGSLYPDAVEFLPVIALLVVGAIFFVYGMIRGGWASFRFRAESDRQGREDIARIGQQLTTISREARDAVREAATEAVEARSAARDAATEAVEASDERTRIMLENAAKQETLLEVKNIVRPKEPDDHDHEDDGSLT